MVKHSKNYQEALKVVDNTKTYHPQEAIDLAKQATYTKFDETVELHLSMGVDPRNASQQVRGVALLPHGLGKNVRVLIFAQTTGQYQVGMVVARVFPMVPINSPHISIRLLPGTSCPLYSCYLYY